MLGEIIFLQNAEYQGEQKTCSQEGQSGKCYIRVSEREQRHKPGCQ